MSLLRAVKKVKVTIFTDLYCTKQHTVTPCGPKLGESWRAYGVVGATVLGKKMTCSTPDKRANEIFYRKKPFFCYF